MATPAQTKSKTGRVELDIEGMHCASCVGRIERALGEVEGADEASVNLATGRATVSGPDLDLRELEAAVAGAGYEARPYRDGRGDAAKATLAVEGMHCASCVSTIEGALGSIEGVEEANVNLANQRARVNYRPERVSLGDLIGAVERAGYRAEPIEGTAEAGAGEHELERRGRAELRTLRRRFVFAALAGAVLLLLTFAWSPLGERATMWLALALATPVQFWAGWPFYSGAWKVGRHGSADMNTLIAMGTSAAYLYSLVATVATGLFAEPGELPDVYFDTAAVIIALILLGRLLEARAKIGRAHV